MSRADAPTLRLDAVEFFERDVRLRMPFRFGVVTLTEAPQAFVRARIRLADGRTGWGVAAELLAPKWFDKDPTLTNEQNFEQLREALRIAASLYREIDEPLSAFGLHAAGYHEQIRRCAARDLNPLTAGFGTALLDRAVIDALGRLLGLSAYALVRENRLSIDARLTPDLVDFDLGDFLAGTAPRDTIHLRHTVGMADPISAADLPAERRVNDGLPETLEDYVAAHQLRFFKLKVRGELDADIERLAAIAGVLDGIADPYYCTLDGNEQYTDAEAVAALWRRIGATPRLARLTRSILFVEQPIARAHALSQPIDRLAALVPVEIDESDATLDAFVEARQLGYTGVSSKSCKGFYRALLNRARCAKWNTEAGVERFFMSAEDLTTQAGIAVQQDLVLAQLIGCRHVERNGHHYVHGMRGLPEDEQRRFLVAHPDLYRKGEAAVRLQIEDGQLRTGSLDVPGLGSAALPDFTAMRPLGSGS